MRDPTANMAEALAVTMEVCGSDATDAAVRIILADLAEYPEEVVLKALARVRRRCKGRLTLATILEQIDDGHPGAEEAWAMVPKNEADTAVLTGPMRRALYAVNGLICADDLIAARVAFKEAYTREVERAKETNEPASWEPSIGWDQTGRTGPLAEAVRLGRIQLDIALHHVIDDRAVELLQLAGVNEHPLLKAPDAKAVGQIKALLWKPTKGSA